MIVLYTDAMRRDDQTWGVGVYDPESDTVTCGIVATEHVIVAETYAVYAAAIHLNTSHIDSAIILTDAIQVVRRLSGRVGRSEDVYRTAQPEIQAAQAKLTTAWQDGWILAWIPRSLNQAHKPLARAWNMPMTPEDTLAHDSAT